MNILEKILEGIDSLHNKILKDKFAEKVTEQEIDSLVKAKEIICSHMDKVENNGWIPVSERLPEEQGWYQCTCSDKEIWDKDIVRDLYYYPKIKQFVDNIRYECNGLTNVENYYWTKYVIAWQTPTEPYKGE